MQLKTISNRIIVELLDSEKVTPSGLVIPDASVEKPSKGVIVCAGPGKVTAQGAVIPMATKVGDKVMFIQGAGVKIKVDQKEYLTMVEDDIIAIIEE